MRNSGEKKYGTRTEMGFKYLPAERNASEITIEIVAKETKELNRKNREDVILVGEETQDSDSDVSSESCKYSIEALNENNLKPSKHTFEIPPKGSTIPADSIGGACKFISQHSSKVLESIFNRNRSNAATFKRTFKPIMSVYRTDEQKKNYESQDSCMCTCICDSDTKQKKKKEKKVKTKKAKKEKKVKKEKKEKKPKKRKSKSGDEFCPGYDPLTDSCQYSYRSSDFTFPDGQDDPNICDCVDDLDEPPRNYGTLDNNWVPCKCGRDCPANRKYILKKKTVNYTFSTTVDSWKPGMVKICCPICTTIDRPALKIMKTKSILAKTKYQAAVLFGCWPLCMLPFYMSQSLILLFCRACHTYLGHYDKVVGCVRPPDPIKHHIAQLIPHHHHIK